MALGDIGGALAGNPVTAGLDILGLGLQLWGGMQQAKIAKEEAAQSIGITQDEMGINTQKEQLYRLQNARAQMENYRNATRLRAQVTAAAVNQGSSVGSGMQSSGLQGGIADITGRQATSAVGLSQSLQTSENVFNLTQDIGQRKIALAGLGADMSQWQGISSLGGSLLSSGGILGGMAKDIFKF